MKKLLFSILAIIIFSTSQVYACDFKVTRVLDGDTCKAEGSGVEIKVRLAGIDAPETGKKKNDPGQPFSQKSKQFLAELVLDKDIKLKGYGMGPYNRQICEVFVNGINVNIELIKAGLAQVYDGKHPKKFNPTVYEQAQSVALAGKIGIWSLGNEYISPTKWRKNERF